MKYNNENKFSFNFAYKNVELIIYLTIGFVAPLFIGHPQYLVGIVVNAILAVSAFRKVNTTKAIALALTPSIGAVMHGVLFGSLTKFLIYFLPAIWISNFVYMAIIRLNNGERSEKNKHLFTTFIKKISQPSKLGAIASASIVKSAILFGTAFVLVSTNIVPKPFLIAMGAIQIITALAGGGVAIGIAHLLNKTKNKS
ncbi:hypothetical protein JXA48_05045 [Candidatus Woesearchaeota archaeon]|nr:hypothetical protein [Candidatus Woesearchaeota archaeon]